MKYLFVFVLSVAAFLLYFKIVNIYAKKAHKRLEVLENKFDAENSEERKKEILEELAEIEAKNFKGNRLLRRVFYSLTVCILGSIIVIPSLYSTHDYLEWFDENISNVEIIIGAIFLMLGIIFNLFCMHMNNQGPLFGMGDDIGESKNSSKKFGIQEQLACIYPQRFPLSRVDPMGAYYLYQKLSYEHTYGRKRR